ncbi:MAG TPA: response regulator [Burkholderiaceae bacterium]|jgi:CheY-like chemotaxis protein
MNADLSRPLRILAVEDSADALHILCELLSLIGHDVTGAADAARALALLDEKNFDVLLTDINLPGMSGVHLARRTKAAFPGIKIIFASGHDDAMASYVGFPSTWLGKPYEYTSLVQALQPES